MPSNPARKDPDPERIGEEYGSRRRLRGALVIAALLTALLVLANAGATRSLRDGPYEDPLSVDASPLRNMRLAELLLDGGLLHLEIKPEYLRAHRRRVAPWTPYVLSTRRVPAEGLPSSTAVSAVAASEMAPIVSVVVDPDALKHLLREPFGRGRQWEVPGFATLYRRGELVFGSPVRVRLHGNSTRKMSRKSYRLYFPRPAEVSMASFGWGDERARVDQVILHSDSKVGQGGVSWHFTNPLALDIAARIGCITPRSSPTLFYLNGQPQGAYAITERLTPSFFARRGLERISWNRVRGKKTGDPSSYRDYQLLWDWLRATETMTLEDVERRVDVENLSRWYLSVLFASTLDAFQGAAVRYTPSDAHRWFWVNWDMDLSFLQPIGWGGPGGWRRSLPHLTRDRWGDPRVLLLKRLIAESPEYRRYLGELYLEVSNYRVTPDFLGERLAHYEAVARQLEVYSHAHFKRLEEFLSRRPGRLRRDLRGQLGLQIAKVLVRSPGSGRVSIDGHNVAASFSGWYLRGSRLGLRIEACRDQFSHWMVDGSVVDGGVEARAGSSLDVFVGKQQDVEAVFVGECSSR